MRAVTVMLLLAVSAHAADLRRQLMDAPPLPRLGGDTTPATGADFSAMAANAGEESGAMFSSGRQFFTAKWTPSPGRQPVTDGLGPVFNRDSCFDCHVDFGRGAPPEGPDDALASSIVRISIPGADAHGGPNPVPSYGDQIQDRAIPGVAAAARPRVTWQEIKGQ